MSEKTNVSRESAQRGPRPTDEILRSAPQLPAQAASGGEVLLAMKGLSFPTAATAWCSTAMAQSGSTDGYRSRRGRAGGLGSRGGRKWRADPLRLSEFEVWTIPLALSRSPPPR